MTHALLAKGAAVDAGDPGTDCSRTDQRGVPRCSDGHPDAGAYERIACAGVLVNRVGTDGKDQARGPMSPTKGADGILGLGGNDRLKGSAGNDGLCGGHGSDALDGGTGIDHCSGGPGSDRAVACEKRASIP
jgi:Ca2+-binding RTX toxin-like protein